MPRKCYLKRHRYPSPFSGTPVPHPDSLLLVAPRSRCRKRYGESLLDNKENGRVFQSRNSLIPFIAKIEELFVGEIQIHF